MILWLIGLAWAAPLELSDVLEVVDTRVPALLAAEARLDQAEAKVLGSRGAFDPTLVGKGNVYAGKDDRNALDVAFQADTLWGPKLKTGYARGIGDYPEYDGDRETGPTGELYGRLEIPILEGLGFGEKRAKLAAAQLGQQEKLAARDDLMRKIRLEAAKRYWKWVTAARMLRVAQDQLELAERRQEALIRQVETGQNPRIDLIDNERVLNERIAKRADTRRKVELAALDLSLVLRAEDGTPRPPGLDEVPPEWPQADPIPEIGDLTDLGFRPDRAKIVAQNQEAEVWQRRARNALRPEVTVTATGIQPLDADRKTEFRGGLEVEAPLAFREGIGGRRAADARLAAVAADRRSLEDAIRAEILGAVEARRLAEERATAARDAATRAQEVLGLERRRFELGGSDLFKLLQREDNLAKDRTNAAEAEGDLHVADAVLRAALAL